MKTRYIVMNKQACMPHSLKYGGKQYRKLALVKTDLPEGQEPKMISRRAKGVISIHELYTPIHVGNTARSAGRQVLEELTQKAKILNEEAEHFEAVLKA